MALGEDGNVSLECKVIGIPQPTLTWFKDGKELRAGDLHQLTKGSSAEACVFGEVFNSPVSHLNLRFSVAICRNC